MTQLTFHDITKKLQDHEPFQFARVGDGEMLCMDGVKGKNTDGHKYFSDLGKALRAVYSEKKQYFVGLQPVKHGLHSNADKYPQDWTNADVLHDASIKGWMPALFKVLQNRNVIVVGNSRLQKLPFINALIEIPKTNAWTKRNEIWSSIKDLIENHHDKRLVILFCAGMMSGLMIDEIAKNVGDKVTAIDCGSVFDPYLNYSTRKYHQQIIDRESKLKIV